MVRDEKETVN
jgi:hypothetical protein